MLYIKNHYPFITPNLGKIMTALKKNQYSYPNLTPNLIPTLIPKISL